METRAVPVADQHAYAMLTSILARAVAKPKRLVTYIQIAIANLVGLPVSLANLVSDVAAISFNMARTKTAQHLDFDEPT